MGEQRSHAIDPVASHRGEMRHTDMLLAALIDDGQTGNPPVISRVSEADFIEKSAVDFIDDLKMTGERAAEQGQGPFFECFWKECMVGIGHGLLRYLPCLVPVHPVFVDKEPHQFCYGDRGVSIIQLHGKALVKCLNPFSSQPMYVDHVLKRAGDKEILLRKPKG